MALGTGSVNSLKSGDCGKVDIEKHILCNSQTFWDSWIRIQRYQYFRVSTPSSPVWPTDGLTTSATMITIHIPTCIVTSLSSTITSLVRKSAPMVALYWDVNFLLTYWFISEVFPTLQGEGEVGRGRVHGTETCIAHWSSIHTRVCMHTYMHVSHIPCTFNTVTPQFSTTPHRVQGTVSLVSGAPYCGHTMNQMELVTNWNHKHQAYHGTTQCDVRMSECQLSTHPLHHIHSSDLNTSHSLHRNMPQRQ